MMKLEAFDRDESTSTVLVNHDHPSYIEGIVALDCDDPRILWVKVDGGWTTVPIPWAWVERAMLNAGWNG